MTHSVMHFHPREQRAFPEKVSWPFRINSLRVSLTNKCNYDCFFCHNEGESKEGHRQVDKFSSALINLVKAGVELWIRKITLTWWEPFLRKDILLIIDQISELSKDVLIWVTSNGFLLTKNKIASISGKVRKLNLNFQSASELTFKEITGVDWLRKITSIIPLLQEAGIHVTLNFVFTSKNSNEIDYVLKYAQIHWCDLKILELVQAFAQPNELPKQDFHQEVQRLSLQYWWGQSFQISPSETIIYYDTIQGKRKWRFISSYCNTFDSNACSTHGELRVSDRFELKHCIMPNSWGLNVYHQAISWDIESIKVSLMKVNELLWVCP